MKQKHNPPFLWVHNLSVLFIHSLQPPIPQCTFKYYYYTNWLNSNAHILHIDRQEKCIETLYKAWRRRVWRQEGYHGRRGSYIWLSCPSLSPLFCVCWLFLASNDSLHHTPNFLLLCFLVDLSILIWISLHPMKPIPKLHFSF